MQPKLSLLNEELITRIVKQRIKEDLAYAAKKGKKV